MVMRSDIMLLIIRVLLILCLFISLYSVSQSRIVNKHIDSINEKNKDSRSPQYIPNMNYYSLIFLTVFIIACLVLLYLYNR